MTVTISFQARHVAMAAAAIVAATFFAVWWASPAASQAAGPGPVDTFAVLARADDPVDALAASSVAGQLGAPVYLTATGSLDGQAAQGLADSDPDVVVLSGGTAALSTRVEEQVAELLPDAQLRRFGGADRTETARLINELPGQLGVDRPVLTGATVAGDVGIDGALTVAGTDVAAALTALTARIDSLEADNAALQATLDGVTRTTVLGRDTLRFEAMNLQLVNGTGTTDGSPNGEGNLIIGYSTTRNADTDPAVDRAGSHYLIIGDRHHWTRFGGLLAGRQNTASGDWASAVGGRTNTASGNYATVTGGIWNTAAGDWASVTGGGDNIASGNWASVTGGRDNSASGSYASTTGGRNNTASGGYASATGGTWNTALSTYTSVSGGVENTAGSDSASVAGGRGNVASGYATSVAGGWTSLVANDYDSRIGNTDFPDG